jgi:hypothetical protein
MGRKKKIPQNDLGIPAYQMESLARVLLPILREYLASDEGRRDYGEWKAKKEVHENEDDSVDEIDIERLK